MSESTPKGTTRIPGEGDWLKIRGGTLVTLIVLGFGFGAWATKMTFDIAQVKTDVAECRDTIRAFMGGSHPTVSMNDKKDGKP